MKSKKLQILYLLFGFGELVELLNSVFPFLDFIFELKQFVLEFRLDLFIHFLSSMDFLLLPIELGLYHQISV